MFNTLYENTAYVAEILDRLHYPAWVSDANGTKAYSNKLASNILHHNDSIESACKNSDTSTICVGGKTFRYTQIPLNHNSGLILHELIVQDDTSKRIRELATKLGDVISKRNKNNA